MHLSRFLSKRVTDLQRARAPQHLQWKFFQVSFAAVVIESLAGTPPPAKAAGALFD